MMTPILEMLDRKPGLVARNLSDYAIIFCRPASLQAPPVTVTARGRALVAWRCRSCLVSGCYADDRGGCFLALGAFLLRHRGCAAVAPPSDAAPPLLSFDAFMENQ